MPDSGHNTQQPVKLNKYEIDLYAQVKIKVSNIHAGSIGSAIAQVETMVDMKRLLNKGFPSNSNECCIGSVEYVGNILKAVVNNIAQDNPSLQGPNSAEDYQSTSKPRVLIIVDGGVADYVSDDAVDIAIFDRDNYKSDPVQTGNAPAHFADLAIPIDVPVAPPDTLHQALTGIGILENRLHS